MIILNFTWNQKTPIRNTPRKTFGVQLEVKNKGKTKNVNCVTVNTWIKKPGQCKDRKMEAFLIIVDIEIMVYT